MTSLRSNIGSWNVLQSLIGCVVIGQALLCGARGVSAAEPNPIDHDFFERKIRPVLVEHCYKCHSAKAGKTEGGLALDTRAAMRTGGAGGPAIVPSDAATSLILAAINHNGLEMPPDRKLPAEVVADFEHWIALGAPDPRDEADQSEKLTVDHAAAQEHWAFQPVRVVPPPAVADVAWPRDPIDQYVLARIETAGLRPAADADRRALLRRSTFLLTGLPPSLSEIDEFLNDETPQAFERVVDRLLASSAFGERFGRQWLDAVRFAESNGKSMNLVWPHAWRYRDYVVSAINRDVPYDQFLREQIAGDMLPAVDDSARAAQNTATGLLAIGAKSYEEGGTREKFLLEVADDQIDVVTRSMLGLTVACARCHDHKFDPIPQADYYALVGIFNSSETLCGPGPKHNGYKGYEAAYLPVGRQAEKLHPLYEAHDTNLRTKQSELGTLRSSRYRHVKNKLALENERQMLAARMPIDSAALAEIDVKIKIEEAQIAAWDTKIATAVKEIDGLEQCYPPAPDYAMAMREGANPADAALRLRGDWKKPGPVVPRGVPRIGSAFGLPKSMVGTSESGRLPLADWMADSRNPLTVRGRSAISPSMRNLWN